MVEVDKNGTVKRAEVWTGPFWPCGSKLDSEVTRVRNEVRDTMMQAKFSPAIRNGKPQSDRVLMNFLVGKAYEDAKGPASSPTATIVHRPELNKSALSLPKPDYPRGARGPSLISIRVIIDEQGKVISAGSVGGGAEMSFSDAARSSACKAKFAPFILDGLPVKVTGELSYGFGLVTR
jgi:hypothetical protein